MPKHACLALGLVALAAPCVAQPVEPFRPITIYVAGTAGGGIDLYARWLARHLGRHVPGNPAVNVQVMPGAGGIRAASFLNDTAPKDGSALATFSGGPLLEPLIGARDRGYDASRFAWIGAISRDVSMCIAWKDGPFRTIDDAKKREMILAGTGAGSDTDTYPVLLNEVLGTKFRVITGYLGTQETALALERGEVDGRCAFGFASIKPSKPDWLKENKLNILLQLGLEPEPDAKGAPMALDLADTPDKKAMIRVMATPRGLGRPYLGPPGMPPERVAELRKAFMAAFADREMREEFTKSSGGDEPRETSGEAMQKLLDSIQSTPVNVRDRLRVLLNP